jgi:hypothetical protein
MREWKYVWRRELRALRYRENPHDVTRLNLALLPGSVINSTNLKEIVMA